MKKCKKKGEGEGEGEMKRFNLKNKLRKSKQINGEKKPSPGFEQLDYNFVGFFFHFFVWHYSFGKFYLITKLWHFFGMKIFNSLFHHKG